MFLTNIRDLFKGREVKQVAIPESAQDYQKQIEKLTFQRDELAKALANLVEINEQHNKSVERVIGRPLDWVDSYLDEARAALKLIE